MNKNLILIFAFCVFTGLFSGVVAAQNTTATTSQTKDLYLISAKPGGVNYVEGKVTVAGKNKKSGYLLKGDSIGIGDKVSTGSDGKAEILLNPGSYVRLAENSSFEFSTTSLEDLQLKLTSGSAMFEVFADDDFRVGVNTPKAKFFIVTSGVYRVSVQDDGSGKIAVWKGKAQLGFSNATEIKAGKQAIVNGSQVAVEKFDRDVKDDLEAWSKTRAKDLARVNSRLQRQDVRNTLISGFGSSRWNMYNSFGLWVYDASFGSFCFLPFGYGWSSPYGYGYGRDIWYFRLPRVIFTQPPTGGGGGGTVVAGKSRVRVFDAPMPYEAIQRKVDRSISDRDFGNSQLPSMSPPVSSGAASSGSRPAGKGDRVF